jgi:uncharacterized protein YgbK (DUF1537 family)
MESIHRTLPREWPEDVWPVLKKTIAQSGKKLVVLDDDPTGTQTVFDVPVLTDWAVDSLEEELKTKGSCFFILTNSRSLPVEKTRELHREIGSNLAAASKTAGVSIVVASRSDSTLRGHFPEEMDVLSDTLGHPHSAWILFPFFFEGGRLTIHDVHYVAEGAQLIPAAQTEFARDHAFGYTRSDLPGWIEEKTRGRISAREVLSISLEDIRKGGPARVSEKLMEMGGPGVCVVNAITYRDVEVFTAGLLEAEKQGRHFLYRTAASFVRVRAGIDPRPLLDAREVGISQSAGGLIVVGSYVGKTTTQLKVLFEDFSELTRVELAVPLLLREETRAAEISRAVGEIDSALADGRLVVLFTSRELVKGADGNASLQVGRKVSDALVQVVHDIRARPGFLIAKGGITSSDVATLGLETHRAEVLGQILPGVPVWKLGDESRYPGLVYVVFPGNVGTERSLAEIVKKFEDGSC